MSTSAVDARVHACRPDLADAALAGQVVAERFVDGQTAQLVQTAPLRHAPAADATLISEGIGGEMVQVFEIANGWAWLQLQRDGYVGYAPIDALTQSFVFMSHRIAIPTALIFPEPNIKIPPVGRLYLGTEISLRGTGDGFVELANGGFVHERSVAPLGNHADDFVAMAERFIGVPYLWGGKTAAGLDCSGLVQVAMHAAGLACPRDSDMQMAKVGASVVSEGKPETLQRGDLVFWPGHVGVLTDAETLLHANAYHMEVRSEPLAGAIERIAADTGAVSDIRRPVTGAERAETPLIGVLNPLM